MNNLHPSPTKAALGRQEPPALCSLLEFISICSFRLLSRIIVLLGLRAWEGRRCALLFINSLNACFKLKPTPHAGSHRNNRKTDCLPAFCYQCQRDLHLLFLLIWGHPVWKHPAITSVLRLPVLFFPPQLKRTHRLDGAFVPSTLAANPVQTVGLFLSVNKPLSYPLCARLSAKPFTYIVSFNLI